MAHADDAKSQWLADLPSVISSLANTWSLTLGTPFDRPDVSASWVAPVARPDGSSAVLKVGYPHYEAEDEAAGLRVWNGEPTVRLLDYDPQYNALLLERCEPGTSLRSEPEADQDAVLASLLPMMWLRTAGSGFRPLSDMIEYWIEETMRDEEHWPDPGLVRDGIDVMRTLCDDNSQDVLLHTDMHAGNVLRAERAEWLVIDPKPFVGDAAYDATQHLFNCPDRMAARPLETVRTFAAMLELPHDRVQLWMFGRAAAQPRSDWKHDVWLDIAKQIAP